MLSPLDAPATGGSLEKGVLIVGGAQNPLPRTSLGAQATRGSVATRSASRRRTVLPIVQQPARNKPAKPVRPPAAAEALLRARRPYVPRGCR